MSDATLSLSPSTVVLDSDLLLRASDSEGDGRTILVRLLSWGELARTPSGPETFERGAFSDVDPTAVVLESSKHSGDVVGRGVALEEREDAAYISFRVSDTSAGRDLLTLVKDGVLKAASAAFRPVTSRRRPDGAIARVKADLRKVAILQSGAYGTAGIVEVRSDMTDQQMPAEQPATPQVDLGPLNTRLDAQDEALAGIRQELANVGQVEERNELESFQTMGEFWGAMLERPELGDELNRALADNTIVPNNTAFMGLPNFIGRVINPMIAKRRTINAVGLEGIPETGMNLDYMEFDSSNSTGYGALVDEQLTEKAEINSGTHAWKSTSVALKTYAGGSDNSWQLLERSTPSFREQLLRQYASEWAWKTNNTFVAALVAGGTADTLTLGADASALVAKLIDQSLQVEAEVDSPANVVLMSSDVWANVAKLPDMINPANPVQNAQGTVNAGELTMDLSGLRLIHEPALGVGQMVTTRGGSECASWHEQFRGVVTQDQIAKLGTDIAIWGYGAPTIYRAAGVIVTTVS